MGTGCKVLGAAAALAGVLHGSNAHADTVRAGPPRAGILTLGEGPIHPLGVNDKLKYYGGRVISNVQVVTVFWTSAVKQATQTQIGGFYDAIVKSAYFDWLVEFDTIGLKGYGDGLVGSEQHIGRGTYWGAVTITPANTKTALTDAEVAAELVAQIQANKLPQPKLDAQGNVDTLYMIDFPAGYDVLLEGWHACQQYGAYHFTAKLGGKGVPYGVHPECGYPWDTATAIHSHELIEAVTDPEVGFADQKAATARPIAWVTVAPTAWDSQEISDVCQNQGYLKVAGYTVAKQWSNYAAACVVTIPICDGKLVPPACRPCTTWDSGNACEGATPACATTGTKVGQCVTCTTAYAKGCTGATPVCDESAYTCVGCLKNGDCAAATPVCELATKTCRKCAADGECGVGKVCDLADASVSSGQCVECTSDAQCGAKRCDLTTHACVDRPVVADAGADGGSAAPAEDGGCSCRAAPMGGTRAPLVGALALLGVAVLRRRRRRSAG
jgi:MYXO-CTERM domain-containing protein